MNPRILLVVAAPAEARAVLKAFDRPLDAADRAWALLPLDARHTLLATGIGKANAAGAVARWAPTLNPPPELVLNAGIAGALPGAPPLALGTAVAATACIFADEGVQTPDSFQTCEQIGFPIAPSPFQGNAAVVDAATLDLLTPITQARAGIATVSTCSGTDLLAAEVAARTGAAAEGMEGAAVALAAARLGLRFGEVRIISNTTGNRTAQVWDIRLALSRLTGVIGTLRADQRR